MKGKCILVDAEEVIVDVDVDQDSAGAAVSGLSYSSAAVAATDSAAETADAVVEMTAVCGSSYCSAAAAADSAAVAAANY